MIKYIKKLFKLLKLNVVYHQVENMLNYNLLAPLAYRWTSKLKILKSMDSVQYILDNHCSVSRYGDGEFAVMRGEGNVFQNSDARLAQRLIEVMTHPIAHHVIGIPSLIKEDCKEYRASTFWSMVVVQNRKLFKQVLSDKVVYLDSLFSRFYFLNNDQGQCGLYVAFLKKIWQERDIIIVEGIQTRSGVGNDLYSNASSIQRILGPATSAFDMYDVILDAIVQHAKRDQLILLSMGMTATVLAYDLAKLGYWAIDIGHLDLEYEWFKLGDGNRYAIRGKYTSEVVGGQNVDECIDPQYLQQIVWKYNG